MCNNSGVDSIREIIEPNLTEKNVPDDKKTLRYTKNYPTGGHTRMNEGIRKPLVGRGFDLNYTPCLSQRLLVR